MTPEENAMTWGERELEADRSGGLSELLKESGQYTRRIVLGLLGLAFMIVIVPAAIHFVPAGHGAVLWKRLGNGTVHQPAIGEGLQVTWPWNQLAVFNLRSIDYPQTYAALSNDGLMVKVDLTLRYRANPANLSHLYQSVGREYERILIAPVLGSIVREVISRYRADELYAFARRRVEQEVKDRVTDLLSYGLGTGIPMGDPDKKDGYAFVEELSVLDVELPRSVTSAIETKMAQDQVAQEYEFRLRRELMETQRREIEVAGIENFKKVATAPWFRDYVKLIEVQSNYELAKSSNAKLIFMGNTPTPNTNISISEP